MNCGPDRCIVCRAPKPEPFLTVDACDYYGCDACGARFLDPAARPTEAEEHAHYHLHDNNLDDPDYRHFLSKLADPLLERLPPRRHGLDFGCGSGSALAAMLKDAGHEVALYDPLFAPDPAPLARRYHFITMTEVAEHLHYPAETFERLGALLEPGGLLAVMTCFLTEDARFAQWHYRRDPTHVVFYRARTFQTIAAQRNWRCTIPVKDVALMIV